MNVQVVMVFGLALAWAPLSVTAQEEVPPDTVGILQAIQLPDLTEILRQRGVPTEEIAAAIEGARRRGVPPGEMTGVLEETAESVEQTGPIENFGAFVEQQLAAGLRGRELAEAIRAEHGRRGIGPGQRLESRGRGSAGEGMRPPEADRGRGMPGGVPADTMADTTGRRDPSVDRGRRGRPDTLSDRRRRDTVPDTSGVGVTSPKGGPR